MRCLLLLFLPLLLAGEPVGLETLPCTSAAWFWTHDGPALPAVNRNLSGNPIRIGGTVFERGIAGHTAFSMVFTLNGSADSFTAVAGMEEEDHPKDNPALETAIVVEVLVDRVPVFRRRMVLGEKAELRIDLRGKYQLELRGTWGKGFPRQRVAFGNPVLATSDPEALRRELTAGRDRYQEELAFTPAFPELPQWKEITVTRLPGNRLRLADAKQEVIVAPDFGGRIIHYSAPGGANQLYEPPEAEYRDMMIRGKAKDFGGGHFIRHQPKDYFHPSDPVLKHGKYAVRFGEEGEIILRSAPSEYLLLRYEYRLKLVDGRLEITNTITNTAPFARDLGVWSVTRIPTAALQKLELPEGVEVPPLIPSRQFTADAKEAWYRVETTTGKLRIRYSLTAEELASLAPWKPLHLFIGKTFSELESHSPTLLRLPGESATLHETWYPASPDSSIP